MSILLSTFGLRKRESMKKRLRKKAVKFIVPVVAVGFINFSDLHHDLGYKKASNPVHKPELHWEIEPSNDYYEVNRDKITAAVTGTSKVKSFFENSPAKDTY